MLRKRHILKTWDGRVFWEKKCCLWFFFFVLIQIFLRRDVLFPISLLLPPPSYTCLQGRISVATSSSSSSSTTTHPKHRAGQERDRSIGSLKVSIQKQITRKEKKMTMRSQKAKRYACNAYFRESSPPSPFEKSRDKQLLTLPHCPHCTKGEREKERENLLLSPLI